MFPVFGHCAAGDHITFLFEDRGEFLVCERFAFILAVYVFFHYLLHLTGGYFLAAVGLHRFGEEELQRVDAEIGLHVFTVANPRNGRYVVSRTFGHVFQYHRAQGRIVSRQEKVPLQEDDGFHRTL